MAVDLHQLFEGDLVANWSPFRDKTEDDAEGKAVGLFGSTFGPEEAARLIAAPSKSKTFVYLDGDALTVDSEFEGGLDIELVRCVLLRNFRDLGGVVVVDHDYSEIRPTRRGFGALVFAQAVRNYRKAGVKRIECLASGSQQSDSTGYIAWPVLGFIMEFNGKQQAAVDKAGFRAVNTHELFLR